MSSKHAARHAGLIPMSILASCTILAGGRFDSAPATALLLLAYSVIALMLKAEFDKAASMAGEENTSNTVRNLWALGIAGTLLVSAMDSSRLTLWAADFALLFCVDGLRANAVQRATGRARVAAGPSGLSPDFVPGRLQVELVVWGQVIALLFVTNVAARL